MKIAILASNFIRIPPRPKDLPKGASGATEGVVFRLTEELVKRGHQVTLFASGDSKTSAQLISVTKRATALDENVGIGPHIEYEHLLISKAYQMAQKGNFDIIHSHFDTRSAFYAPLVTTPTVSTLHSPLDKIKRILENFKKTQYWVSISNNQQRPIPDLNYAGTVYHGIDLSEAPYEERMGNYLVFVGRFVPQKGVLEAVKTAKKLGEKLILLGTAPLNSDYFEKEVTPLVDQKQIRTFGFLERPKLFEMLKGAKALLFPIQWEEPFGLVMVEAMACGTPVIAFARGSVAEIVVDGATGFIVNAPSDDIRGNFIIKKIGIEGLIEAVKRINAMSGDEYRRMRVNCRKHVEEKFTIEKMVEGYERAYKKLLL